MTDIQNSSYEQIEQINKRSNKMTTEKPAKVKKTNGTRNKIAAPAYDPESYRVATAEELAQAIATVRLKTEFSRWLNDMDEGSGIVLHGDINRLKQKVSVFQKAHGRKYSVKSGDNGSVIIARLADTITFNYAPNPAPEDVEVALTEEVNS